MFFKRIIKYSQCWEDTDVLVSALILKQDDVILSITSGGDNSLALSSLSRKRLISIDMNIHQNYLLELKLLSIKELEYKEVLKFFGILNSKDRTVYYDIIKKKLSKNSLNFWEDNLHLIKKGIIHIGKFENYFRIFRVFVLRLSGNKKYVKYLFEKKEMKKHINFYHSKWNTLRWRLIMNLFLNKKFMKKVGRSKIMFKHHTENKISNHYLEKTDNVLKSKNIFSNSYMYYVLNGNYLKNYPYYLKKLNFEKIKNSVCNIEIVTKDLIKYLRQIKDNSFNKFNLSDVFEAMSRTESNIVFKEILRTGKNNARIIFWNNLIKRDVPTNLQSNFIRDKEKEKELSVFEKFKYYEKFYIYKLIK